MITLIYEVSVSPHSVLTQIQLCYPQSSIHYVNRVDRNLDKSILETKPLFSKNRLIICPSRIGLDGIIQLHKINEDNCVLVRMNSRTELYSLVDKFNEKGIKCYYVDNKVDRDWVIQWIMMTIPITKDDAKEIYKRCNGYVTDVVVCVNRLKALPDITHESVLKIAGTREFSIYDLTEYLLGVNKRKMLVKDAVSVVHKYRFSIEYLKKSILNEYRIILDVFMSIGDGVVSLENYKKYKEECTGPIHWMSDYKLQKIIKWYSCISIEYLYWLIAALEMADSAVDLINLIRR